MTTKVEPPKDEVHKLLDKFKEETEDLWEQFMEGVDPDPDKYDQFLDNAYDEATQSILSLVKLQQEVLLNRVEKEVIGEDLPTDQPFDNDLDPVELVGNKLFRKGANWVKDEQRTTLNRLRLEL